MSGAGTVRDAIAAATDALGAAGCDTPRLDAEVLIADVLGVDRGALVTGSGADVPAASARTIGERVRRRVVREPVAYITGRKGFRHIDLAVDARVLIPRPETELLVEVALEAPPGARVHEVGTGSGAVALALMHERPDLRISASDSSARAVDVARSNARALGLDLPLAVARGLPDPIAWEERSRNAAGGAEADRRSAEHRTDGSRPYDLVLANLPYVSTAEMATLAPEIRDHEPHDALVAGRDGLDAIRGLLAEVPAGTAVALEHAPHQAQAVRGLLDRAETHRDLANRERVTAGTARGRRSAGGKPGRR
ncbi:MAG: peptide chain release factor N(5)-glutamine methyltransferase [Thermoleophilaceae bacterium]|nr:peptide chain release factor N(5)-glutamine methyltransferase [Thermoleophilaceae bacterium]